MHAEFAEFEFAVLECELLIVYFKLGYAQFDVFGVVALQHLFYHVLASLQNGSLLFQLMSVKFELHRLETLQKTAMGFKDHTELIPYLRASFSHEFIIPTKYKFRKDETFLRDNLRLFNPPS